jgi:hypothetical protein
VIDASLGQCISVGQRVIRPRCISAPGIPVVPLECPRIAMTPTPRRPLLQSAACTDATTRLRRELRRTICHTSRSTQSPDGRTAHRYATRPDTSAPGSRSPFPLPPLTHRTPPFYAHWSARPRVQTLLRFAFTRWDEFLRDRQLTIPRFFANR